MRVAVLCEFSGIVRDAFITRGHEAVSYDLLPTEREGPHVIGDIRETFDPSSADLVIAHPPCQYLAVSGARWMASRPKETLDALMFVRWLMALPVPHIAIENPVSIISTLIAKPTQIVQPWQHGHGETKATCLWLSGLPSLTPTDLVDGRVPRVHYASPGPERWRERSRTLPGIAGAMAKTWGDFLGEKGGSPAPLAKIK